MVFGAGENSIERLATALRENEVALVGDVLAALQRDLPAYAALPEELIHGDVRRVVKRGLRMFRESLPRGGHPDQCDLDALRDSAGDRADEGVPLNMVLAAYFHGLRFCTGFVTRFEDPDLILSGLNSMTVFMGDVSQAVSEGYAMHARVLATENASARDELTRALLEGRPLDPPAARAGVDLGDSFVVLFIHVGPTLDEVRPGVATEVVLRRKQRRALDAIYRWSRGEAMSQVVADGLYVLIPGSSGGAGEVVFTPQRWAQASRRVEPLITDLARTVRAQVWVGGDLAAAAEVAQAADTCREVALLARRLGRGPAVTHVEDLALEFQLTRPTAASSALVGALDTLETHPDLLDTVSAYIRNQFDRQATAADLHVHTNTVDNRWRKITQLTGLDPASPADRLRLVAAELARATGEGDSAATLGVPRPISSGTAG
ncbi:PucR family transcriptional regulator [Dermacoccaceae bacterium W4C1]